MRGLEEQMDAIAITARQSALIDRWLVDNMGHRQHTVSYAVDNVRRIAYPDLPDEPLRGWELYKQLADHVRRRCLALGIEPKRLDSGGDVTVDNKRCSVCGAEFVSMHGGTRRCPRCRARGLKPPKPPKLFDERRCEVCGMTYRPKAPNQRYCSVACRRTGKREKDRASYERRRERALRLGKSTLMNKD